MDKKSGRWVPQNNSNRRNWNIIERERTLLDLFGKFSNRDFGLGDRRRCGVCRGRKKGPEDGLALL
jgi:hypothetical protein